MASTPSSSIRMSISISMCNASLSKDCRGESRCKVCWSWGFTVVCSSVSESSACVSTRARMPRSNNTTPSRAARVETLSRIFCQGLDMVQRERKRNRKIYILSATLAAHKQGSKRPDEPSITAAETRPIGPSAVRSLIYEPPTTFGGLVVQNCVHLV
ncbi:hypothetical protein RSAG8_11563, partial [Rhizoctonia solani AG-8 WAC10335]